MLTDEDTGMVVLSDNRVSESSHVLDTNVGLRRELNPDRTDIGRLAGGRSVLLQHFLGRVRFES